jgi:hypothetical protein
MGGPREIEAFSNFPAYRARLLFNTFVAANLQKSAINGVIYHYGQEIGFCNERE